MSVEPANARYGYAARDLYLGQQQRSRYLLTVIRQWRMLPL